MWATWWQHGVCGPSVTTLLPLLMALTTVIISLNSTLEKPAGEQGISLKSHYLELHFPQSFIFIIPFFCIVRLFVLHISTVFVGFFLFLSIFYTWPEAGVGKSSLGCESSPGPVSTRLEMLL